MAILNARIKSYESAAAYLGPKQDRPLGHNTRIARRDDGAIQILYHGSSIVRFFPQELTNPPAVTLSSCGWKTSTTKERINDCLPEGFRLWQQRGIWYLGRIPYNDRERWIFQDGITIAAGQVFNAAPESADAEMRALVRKIRRYAVQYASDLAAGKIGKPGAGDCFYCTGMIPGDNQDHLLSHLEENYQVPSLLMRAVDYNPRGLCRLSQDALARLWGESPEPLGTWQQDILKRDATALLSKYFKHVLQIAA